jgi:D-glycero-D-manno-heptose 1,7-bisphosphate phosphatase
MALMRTKRAVFLDKDGTLVENVPYNVEADRIRMTPNAAEGLRRWAEAGFRLIVVSNQSGVARGFFTERALELVRRRLAGMFRDAGVELEGFYYCPHWALGSIGRYAIHCDCRKPLPGLVLRACEDLDVDPSRSWLVGDILDDVEAGNRAGCGTVLLDPGGETEWRLTPERQPTYRAADLSEAARLTTQTEVLL